MKKKFLALVMTLSMVLSLVPMTALAAENGQVEKEATVAAGETTNAGTNEGSQDSGSPTGGDNAGSTGTEPTESEKPEVPKYAAKIGEKQYETLDKAIAAAEDGAIIEVLADCTTAGLELRKDLTIQGAESLESKPTITFTDKGIALWGKLIFKDCKVVMNGTGSTPYTVEWKWQTICVSTDASLTLDRATS